MTMQGAASPLNGTLIAAGTGTWFYNEDEGIEGYYDFTTPRSFRWFVDRNEMIRRGVDERDLLDCVNQVAEILKAPDSFKPWAGVLPFGSPEPGQFVPVRDMLARNFGRAYAGYVIRSESNKKVLCVFTPAEFEHGRKDGYFEWYLDHNQKELSPFEAIVAQNARLNGRVSDIPHEALFKNDLIDGPMPSYEESIRISSDWNTHLAESFKQAVWGFHHTTAAANKAHYAEHARQCIAEARGGVMEESVVVFERALAESEMSRVESLTRCPTGYANVAVVRPGLSNVPGLESYLEGREISYCIRPRALDEAKDRVLVKMKKSGDAWRADWTYKGARGTVYASGNKYDVEKQAEKAARTMLGEAYTEARGNLSVFHGKTEHKVTGAEINGNDKSKTVTIAKEQVARMLARVPDHSELVFMIDGKQWQPHPKYPTRERSDGDWIFQLAPKA